MNKQERLYFEELINKRTKTAEALSDWSVKGVEQAVVQKYSEKAHFIYELLQNADDCKATEVHFELHGDGLRFWHNGSEHFTIISPSDERDDYKGPIGHINSIVAIGGSSKASGKTNEYKIGKFGVGFKAVFQYTATPYIYDDNFSFYIKDLIVPALLDADDDKRKQGETLFWFPFNRKDMPASRAYLEISEKLQELDFPLLFLNHLEKLHWSIDGREGYYLQKVETIAQEGMEVRKVTQQLVTPDVPEGALQKIMLFSRKESTTGLKYCVGFGLNEAEDSLIPIRKPVFCYFPTAKQTDLRFIIHAPFKLIDNREGLKDDPWNRELVDSLAQLAADSIPVLCNCHYVHDDIFDIIPCDAESTDFIAPFYDRLWDAFRLEKIIPTQDGEYVTAEHAYWPSSATIPELIPEKQLKLLVGDEQAKWVFVKLNYKQLEQANKKLSKYLDSIVKDEGGKKHRIDESAVFARFSTEFIEAQPIEWLHSLYQFLLKNENYRKDVKYRPIFLDRNRKAVAAFKYDNSTRRAERILYIDTIEGSGFCTLLPELLQNETTAQFVKEFGIDKPELRDEIYHDILPQIDLDEAIDTNPFFRKFYEYYKQCPKEDLESFLDMIRDKEFVNAYDFRKETYTDEDVHRLSPQEVYFASEGLKAYFSASRDTVWFLDEEGYEDLYAEFGKEEIHEFLEKLGVRPHVRKMERSYMAGEQSYLIHQEVRYNLKRGSRNITDYYFPLFEENLNTTTKAKSLEIWEAAMYEIENDQHFPKSLQGRHERAYWTDYFDSYLLWMLQNKAWLYTKDGRVCKPADMLRDELDSQYTTDNKGGALLSGLLPFKAKKDSVNEVLTKAMTELGEDVLLKVLEDALKEAGRKRGIDSMLNLNDGYDIKREELRETTGDETPNVTDEGNGEDAALTIDLDPQKIEEEIRKRLEEETQKKQDRKSKVEAINNSKKYSYEWFWNYISLMATYSEKLSQDKKASVSFATIVPEKNSKRFFVLDGAGKYIPEGITEAEGVSIQLVYSDDSASDKIEVEGVSRIGQKIQILTKNEVPDMVRQKMPMVTRIDFVYTPVVNLLERLQNAFKRIDYVDSWDDIEAALPPIHYIYGPPGTGKTWTIGKKIEEITDGSKAHILVLTPTNTAADEVCKKLKEGNRKVNAVRLSKATDFELEEMEGIYFDSLSMNELNQIPVVASTIHRLPYYEVQGDEDAKSRKLFQYPWDYVVFDEASMIGLHYIVFAIMAIHKANRSAKFIVAGDPMQIPPVVEITDDEIENFSIQDENIYKMMKVSSFENTANQIRSKDRIENLDTQRRSVPSIGQLYSDLSYSSLLKHFRPEKPEKELPTAFQSIMKTAVTFIDMPLNKTVDAYRIFKLHGSSYHFYSALMVVEMLKRFDVENAKGQNQEWSIGLISPYKAQAILMDKLVSAYHFSPKLRIISDTVHGFQGGQCDMVFFVCNPNSYALGKLNGKLREKCLMYKQYIYNVAISRARDYLVIIHPFSWERNNPYIRKITDSYRINNGSVELIPYKELELKLFSVSDYIKDNSYVTSHDAVNVYDTSLEKKYILKYGLDVLDVQVMGTRIEKDSEMKIQ